jgi:hypothetical protein
MHDVAVGDDIVLAFETELAGIARAGLATVASAQATDRNFKVAAPGRVTSKA